MKNVADIFDAWPSVAEFSRDLGVPYTTAFSWKERGAIPGEHWLAIVRAANRRSHPEVTVELLALLHAGETTSIQPAGFAEEEPATGVGSPSSRIGESSNRTGHFSRWKHLRRTHFASSEEIVEHIRALRDEWDRR